MGGKTGVGREVGGGGTRAAHVRDLSRPRLPRSSEEYYLVCFICFMQKPPN